jgi:hypothetical protein
MVADLVGGRSPESHVGPVAVVPEEVKRDFLPDCRETERNRDETSGAFVLERPDAALDHGEAAILTDSSEALADSAATSPAPELPGDELPALV